MVEIIGQRSVHLGKRQVQLSGNLVRTASEVLVLKGDIPNLDATPFDMWLSAGCPRADRDMWRCGSFGHLLLLITDLLGEYRLKLPSDLVIMIKSLVTAEGTARLIYPELDVFTEAETYIKRLALKRLEPRALWQRFHTSLSRFFFLQRDIPVRISRIINKMESGELSIRFTHENLRGLRMTIENASSRMAFSIIIAALIIGSSMIVTTGIGPLLFGFPALGIVGYIISGVLGLWLVFNIIRAKRY